MAEGADVKDTDESEDEDDVDTIRDDIHGFSELQFIMGTVGFMELVIHHLMRVKNIWPKDTFTKIVLKGVPFWFCDQRPIVKYILEFLEYANKCLMQLRELEIGFILCRRNKDVVEETFFKLKMNDSYDESDSNYLWQLNNLVSICDDLQKTNSFNGVPTLQSGKPEFIPELIFLSDMDTELPENDSDICWIRVPAYSKSTSTSEGKPTKKVYNFISKGGHSRNVFAFEGHHLKKIVPLKNLDNKKYEIKAYVLKKA